MKYTNCSFTAEGLLYCLCCFAVLLTELRNSRTMPNVRSFCSMLTCKSHRSVDVKPTESTGNEKSTLEADSENSKIKLIPHSQIALPRQEFSEKVVLITGSSDGIGAETIKYFAHCGSQVVVTGRNEEKIARVALECDTVSPNSKS